MNKLFSQCGLLLAFLALTATAPRAQTTSYKENFTGATTNNSWNFFNGACLTAGTSSGSISPGQINACAALKASGSYYNGVTLVGGTNGSIPGTDPTLGGALRFTNSSNSESGAIVSNFTFPLSAQGIEVTFTTESYHGDGGGCGASTCGHDGADGISFFLEDASQPADLGGLGGSLAYSCSNSNYDGTLRANGHSRGNDGLVGGYLGVGIDEYGNFLNPGDNSATGPGLQYNRIGLRGAGVVGWSWLNAHYPQYYPSSLADSQRGSAVRATCASGVVMNYNSASTSYSYGAQVTSNGRTTPVADYAALSYSVLPAGLQIANESALYRGDGSTAQLTSKYGVPITYSLKITPQGLLTLSYSYDGGASQPVITGTNIVISNGVLPANVYFGFAASTGGSNNIHEIMCFQAIPQTTSQSSVSGNQKQAAQVVQGSQVYFAFYDPTTAAGSVTSVSLFIDASNNAYLAANANWDASCVLTGIGAAPATCARTSVPGPTAAEPPNTRTMLTYNTASSSTIGIPFEWSTLPTAYQTALDTGDGGAPTAYRLNYLRGDRANEQNSLGQGALTATGYRDRISVLGDIIDSSPTWVGPPSAPYPTKWVDAYNGGTMPENSGQTYAAFTKLEQSRMNLVYSGANDGFLHGFRTGFYDAVNNYVGIGNGTGFVGTFNDGQELIAYMPAYVLNKIQTTTESNNYSSPQYGHAFDVDATPGVGEVFFNGNWHTYLLGGLGAGGAAIYALNITNPVDLTIISDPVFAESNAASLVVGEWSTTTNGSATSSSLICTNTTSTVNSASNCGYNLGNTYGTPQIRRFHSGNWGAIFGNGFGSSSGDGGIYVMLLNATTGKPTFYYLSTKTAGTSNGIAYVTAADLDGDHVADFVYAGDLLGNLWRFDLTSSDPTQWAVTSYPGTGGALYSTGGQPITTQVSVLAVNLTGNNQRLLLEFGTGQQIAQSNASAATYSTAQQSIYGIWDWNLAAWNAKTATAYAVLPFGGFAAPTGAVSASQLQLQAYSDVSSTGVDYRTFATNNAICWAGNTGCTTTAKGQFGWYLNLDYGTSNASDVNSLPGSVKTAPVVYEQVIYSPVLVGDALLVNTTIPPAASYTTCFAATAGGYTMAINPSTGAAFPKTVFGNKTTTAFNYSAVALSGTGTPLVVSTRVNCTVNCNDFLVTQTVSGAPTATAVSLPTNIQGTRLTWIQKR